MIEAQEIMTVKETQEIMDRYDEALANGQVEEFREKVRIDCDALKAKWKQQYGHLHTRDTTNRHR